MGPLGECFSPAAWDHLSASDGATPEHPPAASPLANGPGSLIGFDYARTFNPRERIASASGIVNVGGFVASLLMILVVGPVLGALGPYTLPHFRLAFLVQYPLWAFGLAQVLRMRVVLRRRRVAEGIIIPPLPQAVVG